MTMLIAGAMRGTVAALSNGFYQLGLPDLENRAPSLVGWMSGELDEPIRAALRAAAANADATVVADPVRLITAGTALPRCWGRAWKLVDHLGVVHQVSIEVEEDAQEVVGVRIDNDLIGRSMPPWIERRATARRDDRATTTRQSTARLQPRARTLGRSVPQPRGDRLRVLTPQAIARLNRRAPMRTPTTASAAMIASP